MGTTKHLLDIEEGKDGVALIILKKAGATTVCDTCDETVNNQDESALNEAYKIAKSMITKGDELVAAFKGNKKELRNSITSAYADVDWECQCEEMIKE